MKTNNLGRVGIISDISPQELPPGSFTGGKNVRFLDGMAQKFKGSSQVFDTPPITPYWWTPIVANSTLYWVYCGLTKVYITDGATSTNITRQTASVDVDYAATALGGWNGGFLSGVGIFNNGIDDPQVWSPPSTSTKLTSLKWDATDTWASKSWAAKLMRPFGNFLVALNLTKSGTEYPYLVQWSSPADPGTQPDTWDITDTANLAGEVDLGRTGGYLIDCLPLRDANIIYKEDSAYSMRLIGGNAVFAFNEIMQFGALSRRCIKEFERKHIVLTNQRDVIVHDGGNPVSILDKKNKKFLYDNIDGTNYEMCFIAPNYSDNEMWICYPQTGSSLPDMALVWNYRDDTYGVRELPNTPHIGFGVVDPSVSGDWASDSDTWGSDSTSWGQRDYNPSVLKMLTASGAKFLLLNDTEQEDGANMTSYVERLSDDFGNDMIKQVQRVFLRFDSTGSFTVKVGTQMNRNDSISWVSATFDPSSKSYAPVLPKAGRFVSYRVESSTNIHWEGHAIDVQYREAGKF